MKAGVGQNRQKLKQMSCIKLVTFLKSEVKVPQPVCSVSIGNVNKSVQFLQHVV